MQYCPGIKPDFGIYAARASSECLDLHIQHRLPRNPRVHIDSETRSTLTFIEQGLLAPDDDGARQESAHTQLNQELLMLY